LPNEIKFPKYQIHQEASYHSKLLPTKEITQLLQNSQLISQKSKSSELISKQIDKLAEEVEQARSSNPKKTSELIYYFLEKSKELTKELEEIIVANPNMSEEGKKTLKKIKKLRSEAKEINYLETRVQELTQLIKSQKQKMIQDFLNVLPERELIQQLIATYLELKKAENQNLPSRKLKKECQIIEDKLEEKLGEEFVEKMQPILNDCEKIVS
jgi:hypothetical protein